MVPPLWMQCVVNELLPSLQSPNVWLNQQYRVPFTCLDETLTWRCFLLLNQLETTELLQHAVECSDCRYWSGV